MTREEATISIGASTNICTHDQFDLLSLVKFFRCLRVRQRRVRCEPYKKRRGEEESFLKSSRHETLPSVAKSCRAFAQTFVVVTPGNNAVAINLISERKMDRVI